MNKRIFSNKHTSFVVIAFFIIAAILVGSSISGMANTKNNETGRYHKYYTSIIIEEGDSLWNIATEYMRSEFVSSEYKNMEVYMNEIRSLNQLKSDVIHAGEYIMIPYYSNEIL